MNKRWVAALLLVSTLGHSQALDTREGVCQWRAALLGSMKQERDNGMPKAKARKILYSKLSGLRKAGFDQWIDLTYHEQTAKVPPAKFAETILTMCLKDG